MLEDCCSFLTLPTESCFDQEFTYIFLKHYTFFGLIHILKHQDYFKVKPIFPQIKEIKTPSSLSIYYKYIDFSNPSILIWQKDKKQLESISLVFPYFKLLVSSPYYWFKSQSQTMRPSRCRTSQVNSTEIIILCLISCFLDFFICFELKRIFLKQNLLFLLWGGKSPTIIFL